jgi:multidrug efflux pump subunit AcrB
MVYKESDINTLAAVTAIQNKIKELKPKYPAIQFTTTRDSSEEIQLMFRVLGSSFIFGALLIVVILGWTMGLRIATLVLLAIPFSSGVGLSCLYWLEVPLSSMVVFSFILVVGMVVDGAIIVAENIHRHIERGLPPVEAAKIGIEEVGKPVIMADLTTVAAYLPMLLVPGIMGDFMGVMPIVVGVSLIGSIIADHFVIPVIAARWYRQKQTTGNPETIKSTNTSVGEEASNKDQQLAIRPNLGSGSRLYRMVLNWGLNNRWAIVTCGFLAVAWAVIMSGKIGSNFMPQGDVGQIQVKYELPLGSSVHQTIAYSKIITDSIEVVRQKGIDHGTPEVRNFVSAIGSSEGLASRLENDPAVGPEFGTIMVQLISPMDRLRH